VVITLIVILASGVCVVLSLVVVSLVQVVFVGSVHVTGFSFSLVEECTLFFEMFGVVCLQEIRQAATSIVVRVLDL